MTTRTVRILEPEDPLVKEAKQHHMQVLNQAVPQAQIEVVGSWAVPMTGKAEIDYLVQADDTEHACKQLREAGFSQGPTKQGQTYLKYRGHEILCEAHVVRTGSGWVELFRNMISALQDNPKLREELAQVKRAHAGADEETYREAKQPIYKKLREAAKGL